MEEKEIRKKMLDDIIQWIESGQVADIKQLVRIITNARRNLDA